MSTKIKLSEAMRYGLALIADNKSEEVRSQTLRALERRGLARPASGRLWASHVLTAAGEDWLGIAEEFRTAPRPEPQPEPTPEPAPEPTPEPPHGDRECPSCEGAGRLDKRVRVDVCEQCNGSGRAAVRLHSIEDGKIVLPDDVRNVNTVQDGAARLREAIDLSRWSGEGPQPAYVTRARANLDEWIAHARGGRR